MRFAVVHYDTKESKEVRKRRLRQGLDEVVWRLIDLGEDPDDVREQAEAAVEEAVEELQPESS